MIPQSAVNDDRSAASKTRSKGKKIEDPDHDDDDASSVSHTKKKKKGTKPSEPDKYAMFAAFKPAVVTSARVCVTWAPGRELRLSMRCLCLNTYVLPLASCFTRI